LLYAGALLASAEPLVAALSRAVVLGVASAVML
jgi:hypothetical protein